jgi:Putative Ig domain
MATRVFVRTFSVCLVSVLACALAACNNGEDSSASTAATATSSTATSPIFSASLDPPTTTGDHAPQISGSAPSTISVGQSYRFQPNATDADGDALTFELLGAPSWMTVNSETGLVSGTPTLADAGADSGIVLQVSDGKSIVSLPAFTVSVVASSGAGTGAPSPVGTGSVDLVWVPPTANTDGSALVSLSGYKIYYGNSTKNYTSTITISNPGLTRYVIENLAAGTYFFSVSATSSDGTQSALSQEASTNIS